MHPQFVESSITLVMAAMMVGHSLARSERSHATRAVVGLMCSLMIWTGFVALSRVSQDPAQAYAFACIAVAGAFLVPPAWAWMALSFTERARSEAVRRRALWIFAPTVLLLGALVTNPLHGLLIAVPERVIDYGARDWAGPIFWPWLAWAYLVVVAGSALYVRASLRLMRTRSDLRGRAWLMVAAALLPLCSSVAHELGMLSIDYDRTPMLLGISTLLLYVVDWRYRLLDTMPIARRDVIDQLNDGVVVADADGLIVHMNSAAEAMCEVRLADVSGQPLVRVVAAQSEGRMEYDEPTFMKIMRKMCSQPSGFETQIENYQGRVFEIRGASVTDIDGDVAGLYLILRDRTAGVHYETMLRQTRRSEAVAGLAAGIAHEVNNPLAYVRANVTHMLGQLPKPGDEAEVEDPSRTEEVRDVLFESLEGIDRISAIVDRLQRLSTPTTVAPNAFDVNEVVADALRARGLDGSDDPVVQVDLAPERLGVFGNREGLVQTIVEVLENAERAVAGKPGRIDVRTAQDSGGIIVIVCDDGPGVPAEYRERVFDPFFTTAAGRDGDAGTGLGLAMAAKAVLELDGAIEIDASPSGGAQVVIRLPAD